MPPAYVTNSAIHPESYANSQVSRFVEKRGRTRLSLGEIGSIQRRWHRSTRLLPRRLRKDRIHRPNNCIMDQTGAMNAICFVDKEDVFAENLRERSQTLWAGNRNVLLP